MYRKRDHTIPQACETIRAPYSYTLCGAWERSRCARFACFVVRVSLAIGSFDNVRDSAPSHSKGKVSILEIIETCDDSHVVG